MNEGLNREDTITTRQAYLAGFNTSHGRVVIDNRKVILDFFLPSTRDPIHIRRLDVVIIRLLVFRNPRVVLRTLLLVGVVEWVLHSLLESVVERPSLTLEGFSVPLLLHPIDVDMSHVLFVDILLE